MLRISMYVWLAGLVGCFSDVSKTPDAAVICDATCQHGLFHGVCSSGGRHVFACSTSSGRCRWFEGGCPVGFVPSECEVDDICCETIDGSAWPFVGPLATGMANTEASLDVEVAGGALVSSSAPRHFGVVSSSDETPSSTVLRCEGPGGGVLCRSAGPLFATRFVTDVSTVFRVAPSGPAVQEAWYIELLPASDPSFGRLFIRRDTDFPSPSLACAPSSPVEFSGELTVYGNLGGFLTGSFEDGTRVSLSLAVRE